MPHPSGLRAGYQVRGLDLRAAGTEQGDVCNRKDVAKALQGCVGVVHLAAVSRVIDGERDPEKCWRTNVGGTQVLLDAARAEVAPPATAAGPYVATARMERGDPMQNPRS